MIHLCYFSENLLDNGPICHNLFRRAPRTLVWMNDQIRNIIVVGGGDNGLLGALLLKKLNPDLDITIIDDFSEPHPEIGKSTIIYIRHILHQVLGIDEGRFIREVMPVWKTSVFFENWCGNKFHVPFDEYDAILPAEGRRFASERLYYRYQQDQYQTLGCELAEQGKSPLTYLGNKYNQVAYHLSIERTNQFFRNICKERNISLVDDVIASVNSDENNIRSITGSSGTYKADLYIDASGFNRILLNELNPDFHSFNYPLDSSLVAKVDIELSEILPATVVNSADHGWFWQIDTYDWRDLGYVYASDFVSRKEAMSAFISYVEERGGSVSEADISHHSWESGIHTEAWINNCVAIGNAYGFLEPLESTTYTLNGIISEKLAELVADHGRIQHPGIRDTFNSFVRGRWDNVFDFVSLHYRFTSEQNAFWRTMQDVNTSGRLNQIIEDYHSNGFNAHYEFDAQEPWAVKMLFNRYLFYRILWCIGEESNFYENVSLPISKQTKETVEEQIANIRESVDDYIPYNEVEALGVYESS